MAKNAYDSAIKTYSDYLSTLSSKYNNLLSQLESEYGTSSAKLSANQGVQKTTLTNEIAKRGLTAAAGDTYFDTQQNALSSNQAVDTQDLLNKYQASRLATTNAQSEDVFNINSAIGDLKTKKQDAADAEKRWKKEMKLKEKEYKLSKKNSADDLAYKYASLKNSSSSSSGSKQSILDTYVNNLNNAANGSYGKGDSVSKGLRERLRDQAIAAGLDEKTAQKYMDNYLPIGWEWR